MALDANGRRRFVRTEPIAAFLAAFFMALFAAFFAVFLAAIFAPLLAVFFAPIFAPIVIGIRVRSPCGRGDGSRQQRGEQEPG